MCRRTKLPKKPQSKTPWIIAKFVILLMNLASAIVPPFNPMHISLADVIQWVDRTLSRIFWEWIPHFWAQSENENEIICVNWSTWMHNLVWNAFERVDFVKWIRKGVIIWHGLYNYYWNGCAIQSRKTKLTHSFQDLKIASSRIYAKIWGVLFPTQQVHDNLHIHIICTVLGMKLVTGNDSQAPYVTSLGIQDFKWRRDWSAWEIFL